MDSAVRLRPIGAGSFGTFIHTLIDKHVSSLLWLSPFTRSSGLDWSNDVLDEKSVDAVYIASPDVYHQEQAIACLEAGKHVLVEKPVVPNFDSILEVLEARDYSHVLMVGFQRRFDKEFLHAKHDMERVLSSGGEMPHEILIESFDPVPAELDMSFVVNNSMCHDVDLLAWLLPASASLTWTEGTIVALDKSSVRLIGEIQMSNQTTRVVISYTKCHASYVQRITVDAKTYGYDFTAKDGESCAAVYNDAYVQQFERFIQLVNDKKRDQREECSIEASSESTESAQDELNRLQSYSRTFQWLSQAHQVLF